MYKIRGFVAEKSLVIGVTRFHSMDKSLKRYLSPDSSDLEIKICDHKSPNEICLPIHWGRIDRQGAAEQNEHGDDLLLVSLLICFLPGSHGDIVPVTPPRKIFSNHFPVYYFK